MKDREFHRNTNCLLGYLKRGKCDVISHSECKVFSLKEAGHYKKKPRINGDEGDSASVAEPWPSMGIVISARAFFSSSFSLWLEIKTGRGAKRSCLLKVRNRLKMTTRPCYSAFGCFV